MILLLYEDGVHAYTDRVIPATLEYIKLEIILSYINYRGISIILVVGEYVQKGIKLTIENNNIFSTLILQNKPGTQYYRSMQLP